MSFKRILFIEKFYPFIGENILITRFDFSDAPQNQFSVLNKVEDNKSKKKRKL